MDKRAVQDLVSGYAIETTVREGQRVERFADIVPAGTRLFIAHVPGTDPAETVTLATRLRGEGIEPVRTSSAAGSRTWRLSTTSSRSLPAMPVSRRCWW
jgi:hypothetical protein